MYALQDSREPAAGCNPTTARHADLETRSFAEVSVHGRYAPPVRMIKLTEQQEITPYKSVHPDEER